MRQFGYHVTDRDNPDRGVITQPAVLPRDMRCGTPIPCRGSTGRREMGVTRQAQSVGERVHALPWAKRGELRDRVEGARWGVSGRGGNSIG